mmetsp:Transcript_18135/g.18127  ORF Transcript_18135/g.18127 Transcript_18135/m.18127 type:complete len:314 (+) Transcript_18135:29-970(+)
MVNKLISTFVVLFALASSMPADLEAKQILTGEYDGFKTFINSFMNGYTGTTFNLPATCFSQDEQNTLNQNIVSLFFSILKFKKAEVATNAKAFLDNFATYSYACGLNEITENWVADIKAKSEFWILANFVESEKEIVAAMHQAYVYLGEEKWSQAGQSFGVAMSHMVPVPTSSLQSGRPMYMSFFNGFLLGLQKNPLVPSACYLDLTDLFQYSENVFSDLQKMIALDMTGFVAFASDYSRFATNFKYANDDCDFTYLATFLTENGFEIILNNYLASGSTTKSMSETIADCSSNYNECGQAAGTLVQTLLGWGI